jgi:hypothetical protein
LRTPQAIFNTALKTAIALSLFFSFSKAVCQTIPLPNAFAHNDYRHKHPLYDALQNGYTHVEADVFLKGGRLIIAHINPYFKPNHTLEALYLKPLADRIAGNNGEVYGNFQAPVILMIDIKTDSDKTYAALKPVLEKYRFMLSSFDHGTVKLGAVTVVLSGHKPCSLLMNEPSRLAFIDEDLRKATRDTTEKSVYKMASCKYSRLIKWRGKGSMPNDEEKKLCDFVNCAHRNGEEVRLWASPENKLVWQQLLKCGVDLINTDKLAMLRLFLLKQKPAIAYNLPKSPPNEKTDMSLISL